MSKKTTIQPLKFQAGGNMVKVKDMKGNVFMVPKEAIDPVAALKDAVFLMPTEDSNKNYRQAQTVYLMEETAPEANVTVQKAAPQIQKQEVAQKSVSEKYPFLRNANDAYEYLEKQGKYKRRQLQTFSDDLEALERIKSYDPETYEIYTTYILPKDRSLDKQYESKKSKKMKSKYMQAGGDMGATMTIADITPDEALMLIQTLVQQQPELEATFVQMVQQMREGAAPETEGTTEAPQEAPVFKKGGNLFKRVK